MLPFAVLSKTEDKRATLTQVAQEIEKIDQKSIESNISACTEILAGLVLEKQVITNILREETMKESVIYQDIIQQGIEKGVRQGIEQGIEQGKIETALKMLEQKMPLDLIVTITELPLETIEKLQLEIN